jgi:hypothetical protein
LNRFCCTSFVVLGGLVGCNLHSGSGIDPDEIVEGGSDGESESDGGATSSGSGGSSGSSSGGTSGGSSGGSGSGSGGDFADATADAGIAPADAGNGGLSCANSPSTCVECCRAQSPSGYQAYYGYAQACLCGDGGDGSGACAAACSKELCLGTEGYNPNANDACTQCVAEFTTTGDACYEQIQSDCSVDPSCTQFADCYSTCPAGAQ